MKSTIEVSLAVSWKVVALENKNNQESAPLKISSAQPAIVSNAPQSHKGGKGNVPEKPRESQRPNSRPSKGKAKNGPQRVSGGESESEEDYSDIDSHERVHTKVNPMRIFVIMLVASSILSMLWG